MDLRVGRLPLLFFAACALARAQAAPGADPLRVLFLGGGTTSHDPAGMRAVLQPVFERAGMRVEYHTDEAVLDRDSLARFDALFVYDAKKGKQTDGTPDLTAAQEDALYAWVEAGHPFVAAHSASSSYLGNPRWAQLIGAEYTEHGNDFKYVSITRPDHPAMEGVSPPTAWDEGRLHKFLRQDLTILETLNDEKTPWTWVRPQGKGWVYYTSSGHDTRTWNDTAYQGQLVRALRWGAAASRAVSLAPRASGAARGIDRAGAAPSRLFLPGSDAQSVPPDARDPLGRAPSGSPAPRRSPGPEGT